ncbi:glycosyltransferase family 4 protein [Pedobacter nutrimenti]|uniref:glycosyltransferase family 4 protein n=1 Tax=Pedobacter nutrimenti TaxID=1241337 RepID=UPI00292D422E|nr:glycosyltransferase family 4 protein [Pedobacter nutrimenti]
MNILFLTILGINDVAERGLYTDLMRQFSKEGHSVYIACPLERRFKRNTCISTENGIQILRIKTLNFQKANIIEKGIGTLLLENQYFKAIKKYYSEVKFDLVLYSTPPITFTKVVSFFKRRDQAKSYLLLKDIFPQNAVDLGMFRLGGILHRYFRKKEKALYAVSDYIGCMSPANVEFVRKNNNELDPDRIEVNPNSIDPIETFISKEDRNRLRTNYSIPLNATVFIYGGNLGKPQGIDFLIEIIRSNCDQKHMYFMVVGTGTEFPKLKEWFEVNKPINAALIEGLVKDDYDQLLQSCDVGLIFLDRRFTIPNFPSRLLSYMECKMPVLAATDINTDIGRIIEENQFGFWCLNGDTFKFNQYLNMLSADRVLCEKMGHNSYSYLMKNYLTMHSYQKIINHFPVCTSYS